jgi:hypothetical protein
MTKATNLLNQKVISLSTMFIAQRMRFVFVFVFLSFSFAYDFVPEAAHKKETPESKIKFQLLYIWMHF